MALASALAISVGTGSSGRFVPDVDRARAEPLGPVVTIRIGGALHVQAIAPGFLGLSLEYRTINEYAGRNPSAINPILVRLIRNLSPGERPQLRIGGDSTDRTWWPAAGLHKPLGAYIKLTRHWGAIARSLVRALDARVILGIDLEANSARVARVEARKLLAAIGRHWVQALELGNEPELYGSFTWYHTALGAKMPGRAAGYDFPSYLNEFSNVGGSLPHLPLAGPAVGSAKWTADLGEFIAAEPRIRLVTLHGYPLQLCYVPSSAKRYPSIAHLLAPAATTGLAARVAAAVAQAHANHLTVRMDEVNTISCGKAPAVGKSFASALWVLQALFAYARIGVDGVNIHSYVGAPYALFRFHHAHGAWSGVVNPEYYGMLMFAQAAPPRSKLLAISGAARAGIRAWATRAPGHVVRVVLINDGLRERRLSVRVRGGGQSATLERLIAPSLAAETGVTLGGQSFGSVTRTGTLRGPLETDSITRVKGAYVVAVPGESVALLTIR